MKKISLIVAFVTVAVLSGCSTNQIFKHDNGNHGNKHKSKD